MAGELIRREKMLVVAVAANDVAAAQRDGIPKGVGDGQVFRVAGEFVFARRRR